MHGPCIAHEGSPTQSRVLRPYSTGCLQEDLAAFDVDLSEDALADIDR